MEKIMRVRSKATLLLISSILLLCIGFIIVGCGTSPQLKITDPNKGSYALDFTDCPVANDCTVAFTSTSFDANKNTIQNKPITIEAWIKPKANSDGIILHRSDPSRGATLKIYATSTPSVMIIPQFQIRRVVTSAKPVTGTSSVAYTVSGSTALNINEWNHVAGILTNQQHSAVHPGVTCSGAEDDPWHLDIYQDGTLTACAATLGNETDYGLTSGAINEPDPTIAAESYAEEPADANAAPGKFAGIIDEARIWNTERSVTVCKDYELGLSGTCNRMDDTLIFYNRFNEGKGHKTSDWAGVFGQGTKEYQDPNVSGEFLDWESGWTTDVPPSLIPAD